MKLFSNREVIKFGWHKTKENVAEVVTAIVFFILLSAANHFLKWGMSLNDSTYNIVLYGFIQFALAIIGVIFSINLIKEGLVIVRGGKANVKNLLKYPECFWRFIGGQILAGIIIVIGLIIFIIPGIIAGIILIFTKPVLVDLDLGPIECLKKSRELTKGHLWQLFVFCLAIILLNIVGVLVLGIGLLFTIPITFFAFLHLYDRFLKKVPLHSHS